MSAGQVVKRKNHPSCVLFGPALDHASVKAADHALVSIEEQMRQKEAYREEKCRLPSSSKRDKWRLLDLHQYSTRTPI
jgi:hypothetical protein